MFAFLIMICNPTFGCESRMIERKTFQKCEAARLTLQRKHVGRREVQISKCLPVSEE